MDVRELNKDQLTELKQAYLGQLADSGEFAEVMGVDYDEPSYEDLAFVDDKLSDEFIFEHYEGMDFEEDDFFISNSLL
ncbi:MAG: hypothetical protein K5854_01625 [Prevotella sp.]|nr:hypothetical protein [Prevotella sp.]